MERDNQFVAHLARAFAKSRPPTGYEYTETGGMICDSTQIAASLNSMRRQWPHAERLTATALTEDGIIKESPRPPEGGAATFKVGELLERLIVAEANTELPKMESAPRPVLALDVNMMLRCLA